MNYIDFWNKGRFEASRVLLTLFLVFSAYFVGSLFLSIDLAINHPNFIIGGTSAVFINLAAPNTASGSEQVLLGAGISLIDNKNWLLSLLKIDATNGDISYIDFSYEVTKQYFDD